MCDRRMKRFWLFGGHDYEIGGGMHDFVGSFDSLYDATEEAKRCKPGLHHDGPHDLYWWHVVDSLAVDPANAVVATDGHNLGLPSGFIGYSLPWGRCSASS